MIDKILGWMGVCALVIMPVLPWILIAGISTYLYMRFG